MKTSCYTIAQCYAMHHPVVVSFWLVAFVVMVGLVIYNILRK